MNVRTPADDVSVWLTGEFTGRLPASAIEAVVRATRADLDGRIVPDEVGELLYRMARARLQRILAG
ncbi:hypothetical protein ATK36_4517 [Amycolatopsis sulphurea]|uniref:Uncharacterized protein n=1 Tax=Amycolatopsis sulphurea TaxID=76022 RepID=A0A2A9FF29_9PSEU|nr:hypothetical protein [Amycolatopsis sulphurea]PFG49366.1 hypothetical protein ATK36_4517 [Amycolatopsis sulphurea]